MRRTRYRRQPAGLPHRLTGRDVRILGIVDRFHFLTSQQIADLLTTSRQAINKRLKLLFNHHYLGKLPAQLSPHLFNSPDVYFVDLDRRAAQKMKPGLSNDWLLQAAAGWHNAGIELLLEVSMADLLRGVVIKNENPYFLDSVFNEVRDNCEKLLTNLFDLGGLFNGQENVTEIVTSPNE